MGRLGETLSIERGDFLGCKGYMFRVLGLEEIVKVEIFSKKLHTDEHQRWSKCEVLE